MLGDLATVDPAVDVDEAAGKVGVVLLDLRVTVIIDVFSFLVRRYHDVLVHQLVQDRTSFRIVDLRLCTYDLMERMTESAKAVCDYFGERIAFVNVLRNMSVSCDCEGVNAEPVVTPNIGILASRDICAIDQASVDLVYALSPEDRAALVERIESRRGIRQLIYMNELGMGNVRYRLVDIDNGDVQILPADAVADVVSSEAK